MAVVEPVPHLTTSSMSAICEKKLFKVSFVKLKTSAVTPINNGCQRPVDNSLDFKLLKDVNLSQYKKNKSLCEGEGRDW